MNYQEKTKLMIGFLSYPYELVYKRVNQVGSLLLRVYDIPIEERIRQILEILKENGQEMPGAFSVLSAKKLRIRRYSR